MSYEDTSGRNVKTQYGPRIVEKGAGTIGTKGRSYEVSIDIDPDVLNNGGPLLVDVTIPASSTIEDVYYSATEAFALGGTTPTILVGTDTSEVTNGFVVTEAQAEATAPLDLTSTLTGTWAAPLVADTVIGVTLGGTTPTVGTAGKAKVVIRYTKIA